MTEAAIARLLREAGPRPTVPRERSERVRQVVREQWVASVRARRRRRHLYGFGSLGALAAAAIVILAVRVSFRSDLPSPATPAVAVGVLEAVTGTLRVSETVLAVALGDRVFTGAVLETDRDARAALRLSSGPSLRLDMDTRLQVITASAFLLERGAVYVDSGPDTAESGALSIETAFGVARDVGTQFEVRLRDGAMLVRVREGLVELTHEERVHEASAGNEIRLAKDGALDRRSVLPYAPQWAWVTRTAPPFALQGQTLETFLDWVSRERGWTPRFEDARLAAAASTILLEGSVLEVASEAALRTVLPTCGLSHRIENGVLWIVDMEGDR